MTVTASGRPLRFFALVMTAWTTMRLLNQPGTEQEPPAPPRRIALAEASHVTPPQTLEMAAPPRQKRSTGQQSKPRAFPTYHSPPTSATISPIMPVNTDIDTLVDLRKFITFPAPFANPQFPSDLSPIPLVDAAQVPLLLQPSQGRTDRWHGSAWMLWRDKGEPATNIASVGRLGGSQVGLRIDYDLTPDHKSRTSAYARATSALQRPYSQEAAIGIAYQPARTIPISLAVERRIALGKGGRNANAVLAVGGFGPTPVGQNIAAEGYAQAGMVGFNRHDMFIDGKLSISKAIAGAPLRIGATISGGAQPGVERIDIGPEIQVRLTPGSTSARLSVEWRERIVGRAAPSSGLAITLAADF